MSDPLRLRPLGEHAALIEDAAATAAYHRAREEERVPIGVVDRLIARENPVRVWREHRGHSLRRLAERAGIGIGYLSQIENGERKGTVETLKKIAAALDVELDDLT
jgi:DNA-binding Xre family transcriptional regulator